MLAWVLQIFLTFCFVSNFVFRWQDIVLENSQQALDAYLFWDQMS